MRNLSLPLLRLILMLALWAVVRADPSGSACTTDADCTGTGEACGTGNLCECDAGYQDDSSGDPSTGCEACAAGTYKATIDSAATCATAGAGYYTVDASGSATNSAAVGVDQAGDGYYTVDASGSATNSGAVGVEKAAAGYYACDDTTDSDGTGVIAGAIAQCDCPAGYYSVEAASACTQAQAGYRTVDSNGDDTNIRAVAEAQAEAGFYACDNGSDTDGTGVNAGATEQCDCPAGYYSADGAWQCTQAQAGYYTVDSTGSDTNINAVAEKAVDAGYFACDDTTDTDGTGVIAGAIAQCDCPSGYFSSGTTSLCTVTQLGYYSVGANGDAAQLNAVGEEEADAGTYACKNGDTDGTGVTSAADDSCDCLAGTYSADGATACSTAASGYFTSDSSGNPVAINAVQVTLAPDGYYTVDATSTATNSGAVNVVAADAGYYACDDNTDSDGTGVTSGAVAQCSCPSGYYSANGASSCTQAPQGYYTVDGNGDAISLNAVAVQAAAAGYYSCATGDSDGTGINVGAVNECACPAGMYSAGTIDACSTAAAGFYTTDASGAPASSAATSVTASPSGYYTVDGTNTATASGAVNIAQVSAGYYGCDDILDIDGTGRSTGATMQCNCPSGMHSLAGAHLCTSAQQGYYAVDSNGDATNLNAVGEKAADQGYYSCNTGDSDGIGETDEANDQCACPIGTYSTGAVHTCTTTPAGYYAVDSNGDATASSAAVDIQEAKQGYYTVDATSTATNSGAVDEAQADAGYYACDDNTDSDGTGVTSGAVAQCSCPSGMYSSDGADACANAQQGYYAVDSGNNAVSISAVSEVQASAGYYACKTTDSDGTGEASAADDQCLCPVGAFSSAGSSACTNAASGYYTIDSSGNACDVSATCTAAVGETTASAGYYACDDATDGDGIGVSSNAIAECACPTDSNYNGGGDDAVGDTQSAAGSTECVRAPSGEPSTQPSSQPSSAPSGQPSSHPSGQPSSQPSSMPSSQPSSHPSGKPSSQPSSMPSGQPSSQPSSMPSSQPSTQPSSQPSNQPSANPTDRPVCPAGQYLDVPTMTCTDCSAGKASTTVGAEDSTTCVDCVAGTYSDAGAGTCTGCGIGTYSAGAAAACTSCGAGMETAAVASTLISDCVNCGTGKYGPGAQACVVCAVGTYADTQGQATCTDCAVGKYAGSTATVTCTDCAAGKYADTAGTVTCTDCAAGQYALLGSDGCTNCPGGTSVALGAGVNLAACADCVAGTYSVAGGLCTDCALGSYAIAGTADACTDCPVGRYVRSAQGLQLDDCTFCPDGTSVAAGTGEVEADCTNCVGGTYADGGVTVSECTNCAAGRYSAEAARACTDCPLGTYNDEEGLAEVEFTVCVLCPITFYADQEGMEICTLCPNGRLTPFEGAFDEEQCVSPAMNFITAWVCVFILIPLSLEYMIHGRYHRIAFLREERVSKKLTQECRALMTNMYYYVAKAQAERIEDTSSRLLKTWVFLMFGLLTTIILTVLYFVLTMSTIFFRSMILWRNFKIPIPFENIIERALSAMAYFMEFEAIQMLFVPFVFVLDAIADLEIDLEAVNVTCEGALAPIELFFNLIILGLAIIIIESDYQIFRALTFASTTDKFLEMITQPLYRVWAFREQGAQPAPTWRGLLAYTGTVIAVLGASVISSIDIFQGVLQYVMSFVNVESFTADNWKHANTPECNDVPGYIGFDTYIAYTATVEFYLLAIPGVYELSKVLVPGIPKFIDHIEDVSNKRDPKESMLHWIKYTSILSPDLLLAGFSSLWISRMKKKTPPTDFFNVGAKKPVRSTKAPDGAENAAENSWQEAQQERRRIVTSRRTELTKSTSEKPAAAAGGDGGEMSVVEAQPISDYEGDARNVDDEAGGDEEAVREAEAVDPALVTRANPLRDNVRHHHIHSFRMVSVGALAESHDRPGLYLARPGYSVKLWSCFPINVVRGFVLVRIDRKSGRLVFIKTYDVHGNGKYSGGRDSAALARDLNESNSDCIVVIFSKGHCAENREDGGLPAAISRCGGSEDVFVSDDFKDDSAYTLVGIPSCGDGNGFELMQSGGKKAILDINFEVTLKGWKMKEVHVNTQEVSRAFFISEKSYLLSTLRRRTALENARWLQRQSQTMPSYFTLCKLEYDAMTTWIRSCLETDFCLDNCAWFFPIVPFIPALLCIIGLGHVITSVGRRAWAVVAWKYYKFLLLCFGVWTDDLVDLYKVHDYARNFSVVWEKPVRRMNRKEYDLYRRKILYTGHGVENMDDLKKSFDNSLARRVTSMITSIGDEDSMTKNADDEGEPEEKEKIAAAGGKGDKRGDKGVDKWGKSGKINSTEKKKEEESAKKSKHEKQFYEESKMMQELQQSELKRKMRNDYSQIVYALVATRGVILQLYSLFATVSIFAGTLASTPTFVFSEDLRDNLPELIITDAFVDARTEEQEVNDETEVLKSQISIYQDCVPNPETEIDPLTGRVVPVPHEKREEIDRVNEESIDNMKKLIQEPPREVDEWIVLTMGIVYLVTESRLFAFLFNLYKFTLTVGILFSDPKTLRIWMFSAVIIIIPYAFVSVLKFNVIIGKAVDISDDDIKHALSCVGLEFLFTKYVTDVTQGKAETEESTTLPPSDAEGANATAESDTQNKNKKTKKKKKKKNEEESGGERGRRMGDGDAKKRNKKKRKPVESGNGGEEEDMAAGEGGATRDERSKRIQAKTKAKEKGRGKARAKAKARTTEPLSSSEYDGGAATSGAETEPAVDTDGVTVKENTITAYDEDNGKGAKV